MKKSIGAAAVAALVLAGVAFAGDRAKLSNKDVHKESALAKHAHLDSGQAPSHAEGGAVAGVLEQLPKLTYRAGELETPCFKTALAQAGDQDKLQYVVAGKTYHCRGEATAALASLLEQEAEKLMTVRPVVGDEYMHCPTMAKARAAELGTKVAYRLAGLSFETEQEAESTAGIVREAIAKMAAGKAGKDKPSCCPKAGKSGCGKGQAQTVAAKARSGCSKNAAKNAAGKAGGGKGNAQTVAAKAAEGGSGCSKSAAKTAAGKAGGGKGNAQTVAAKAAEGRSGRSKNAVKTAAGKSGCGKGNAQTAAAKGTEGKSGCSKSCAKTVAGQDGDCCAEAEKRLDNVQAKLRLIVETAAKALSS